METAPTLEPTDGPLTFEELQLAARNRGMPLEACRATDSAGEVQPLVQPWNYQGLGNNLVQRVQVSVR